MWPSLPFRPRHAQPGPHSLRPRTAPGTALHVLPRGLCAGPLQRLSPASHLSFKFQLKSFLHSEIPLVPTSASISSSFLCAPPGNAPIVTAAPGRWWGRRRGLLGRRRGLPAGGGACQPVSCAYRVEKLFCKCFALSSLLLSLSLSFSPSDTHRLYTHGRTHTHTPA